ncbi:hypothetical protein [Candidatus Amoebophilus asiaticus]|nr:hypothetical protein [Candidatus Amoebophilus asiaticus]
MKRIKFRFIYKMGVLFSLLSTVACKEDEYADIKFNSHLDRKIFLNYCGEKAMRSEGEKKKKYLKLYFRALPRDFETLFKTIESNCHKNIFYDTHTGVFGNYLSPRNPWGKFYPKYKSVKTEAEVPKEKISKKSKRYLDSLKIKDIRKADILWFRVQKALTEIIPDSIYYEKIISFLIGGFGGPVSIEEFRLVNEELLVDFLERKTDDEIAGFWFFYYNQLPHPVLLEIEDDFYKELEKNNPRMAKLMQKAYEAVLESWEGESVTR